MVSVVRWVSRWASVGGRGERVAFQYLHRSGYRVLARNRRSRLGEVDLIAEDPDRRAVVFVEVKTRQLKGPPEVTDSSPPEIHVNTDKQRKVSALAAAMSQEYGWTNRPVRFDVVGVDLVPGEIPTIRHHVGAFESWI